MNLGSRRKQPGWIESLSEAVRSQLCGMLPNRIPSVLAEGLLIRKVIPRYPSIGVAIHLEGTVVLQATISKSGTIENLRVMSGPAVLQRAALDAVAQWRYRPYLLNGEPVEVETTVNVEFLISSEATALPNSEPSLPP